MIRRLRTLWADLKAIGDPVAVDTDWHDLPQDTHPLADLPPEVRHLVHTVDRMRDQWADACPAVRRELWTAVHAANDTVWEATRRD